MLNDAMYVIEKGAITAFIDCDKSYMLYRKFGWAQARILLYKQDELKVLEAELLDIDRHDEESEPK